MLRRRDFHRLTAATAGALLPAAAAAAARAAEPVAEPAGLTAVETDVDIAVDNGPVRLVISKVTPARLTSLALNGQELLGGGRGNFDMNNAREGDPLPLPPADNSYEIRRGEDFVDVAFRFSPTGNGPFWLERHHIVRAGEPGLHLATVFDHTADLHGFRSDQHRYVFFLDPALFTHISVPEDPIGDQWRAGAARMPTPAELASGTLVMDATYDLAAVGSAYPRRYYTKYDWAVFLKDHIVHGLHGDRFGIWAVLGNREAFCGGPVRQDLTAHQTDSRPVLLVEPQATHYGSPPVRVAAGEQWLKTYGPYFVLLTDGAEPAAARAEAMRYAHPDAHARFYDRVALPGWVPTDDRAAVHGEVDIAGVRDPRGAVVVLSDNGVDFQRTARGYAYWTQVRPDGRFALRHVRPGAYRLTVYRPGVWGEYVRDDVRVAAACRVDLGAVSWRPLRLGRTVFQLGTPDRTAVEFRRGAEFRQWGTSRFFAEDFPAGVAYTVGSSTERDWNYLHFQRIDGVDVDPWRIRFDLDRSDRERAARPGATATLTIALAAWGLDTARDIPATPSNLTVRVNDAVMTWEFVPDESRGATYRSGCAGRYFRRQFAFDASVLRPAGNEVSLRINENTPPELANTAAYDAIRLEID